MSRRGDATAGSRACHARKVTPVGYTLVVEGELGARYSSAFEGMRLECAGGKTSIIGEITDQAHLQGLLEQIAALGLKLVSVTPVNGR